MMRTLTSNVGLVALVVVAAFSPMTSGTAQAQDWSFSNLWKSRTFSSKKISGGGKHLHLRVSGKTIAVTNPLNQSRRMTVRLYAPDGRRILHKTVKFTNSSKTHNFYLSNKAEHGKYRILLIPRDNTRFQGSVKFYNHY